MFWIVCYLDRTSEAIEKDERIFFGNRIRQFDMDYPCRAWISNSLVIYSRDVRGLFVFHQRLHFFSRQHLLFLQQGRQVF